MMLTKIDYIIKYYILVSIWTKQNGVNEKDVVTCESS
jgi:hypothetical protein